MSRPATVTFERIGRHRDVPDLAIDLHDHDDVIVDALLQHARRYLGSPSFSVDVDDAADGGTVLFDGGRFGRGTISESSA